MQNSKNTYKEKVNNDKPLVSVIVPVYNAEQFVVRCILSIENQDYDRTEIIIVENNSTDKSYEVCLGLAKEYSNIRVLQTKKTGVSNARNIGMDIAAGDIITFCDADDYYEECFLNIVIDDMNAHNYDIAVFGLNNVDEGGNIIYSRLHNTSMEWDSEEFLIRTLLDKYVMGSVWNRLYKREILNTIRFDTGLSMMEDAHFNALIACKNRNLKCRYLNIVGYNYVGNDQSATNRINNIFHGEKLKYIEAVEQIEEDCELTCKENKAVNASKALLCSNTSRVLHNERDDMLKRERIRWSKKMFWSNYREFIMCRHVTFKYKVKATLKNIII